MQYSLIIKMLFSTSYFIMCFPLPCFPHPCDFLISWLLLSTYYLQNSEWIIFITNLNPYCCLPATQLSWHYRVAISVFPDRNMELCGWGAAHPGSAVVGWSSKWSIAMCTCQLLPCCKTSPRRSHCPSPFLGFAMGSKVSCICPKQKSVRNA